MEINMTTANPNIDDQIVNIYNTIETLAAGIDTVDVPDLVEMGAALNSVSSRISARLSDIKARLRNAAEDEGLSIGTMHLDGTKNGRATVTIAKPSVALGKDADVPLLKQVLGDSFPAYFEEKVSYKVRTGALDDMSKIASQDRKDLVMKHVTVKDSTPRVSFHRD